MDPNQQIDSRLVAVFTSSSMLGGFLNVCMLEVINLYDKEFVENDLSKTLKKMASETLPDVLRSYASALLKTRNDVIHNRVTGQSQNFAQFVELLKLIQVKTENTPLLDAFLLLIDAKYKIVQTVEETRESVRMEETEKSVSGTNETFVTYKPIKFTGTFKKFIHIHGYAQIVGRKVTIKDELFIVVIRTKGLFQLEYIGGDERSSSLSLFPMETVFHLEDQIESYFLDADVLYQDNEGRFYEKDGPWRVKYFCSEKIHLVDSCFKDEIRYLRVDGYKDGDHFILRSIHKLSQGLTELTREPISFNDFKLKHRRDSLKGLRVQILDGIHIGKMGTFKAWSGTSVVVVFDDQTKTNMNASRRFKLV
jgi:hypothetical protein